MPKIKRWFPVSHDINSDHEVWQLTDSLGDRSLRIWLEILSIADRNEGWVPLPSDAFAKAIAFKCHTNAAKVRQAFDYFVEAKWLVRDHDYRTRNHAKYHITKGDKKIPSGNLTSAPPSFLPSEPNYIPPIVPQGDIETGASSEEKKESERSQPKRKKQSFPEDFCVTEEHRAWAREKGYRSPDLLFESFRDHHRQKGSVMADWDAALRTWVRNDTERFGAKQPTLGGFVG